MRGKVQRWFGRKLDFRFGNGLLGLERWLGSSCRFRVRVFLGFRDLFWRWRRVSEKVFCKEQFVCSDCNPWFGGCSESKLVGNVLKTTTTSLFWITVGDHNSIQKRTWGGLLRYDDVSRALVLYGFLGFGDLTESYISIGVVVFFMLLVSSGSVSFCISFMVYSLRC